MHHGDFRIKRDLEATKKKEIVRGEFIVGFFSFLMPSLYTFWPVLNVVKDNEKSLKCMILISLCFFYSTNIFAHVLL